MVIIWQSNHNTITIIILRLDANHNLITIISFWRQSYSNHNHFLLKTWWLPSPFLHSFKLFLIFCVFRQSVARSCHLGRHVGLQKQARQKSGRVLFPKDNQQVCSILLPNIQSHILRQRPGPAHTARLFVAYRTPQLNHPWQLQLPGVGRSTFSNKTAAWWPQLFRRRSWMLRKRANRF